MDTDAASLLIAELAELAANAALHGRVPGRGARLDLTFDAASLLVEVVDARGDRPPVPSAGAAGVGARK
ncbi:hypothetical protein ACPYPG_27730 [Streptomyces sp. FR-108]|uniref:hypothetical protein n=1 Tax=Streptomyces sp. FR-108 TaxID=3416665 RepID=UPI003CF8BF31